MGTAQASSSQPLGGESAGRRAHLLAVRSGPYFLALLGTFLAFFGALGNKSDAVAVALITLGALVAVAAAVLTRVEGPLEVGTSGMKATLSSIAKVDPGAFTLTVSGPAVDPSLTSVDHAVTIRDIIDAAPAAGWASSHTAGTNHRTISRSVSHNSGRYAIGDTVSVALPDQLDEPASPQLLKFLRDAGFPVPTV